MDGYESWLPRVSSSPGVPGNTLRFEVKLMDTKTGKKILFEYENQADIDIEGKGYPITAYFGEDDSAL